MPQPTNKSWLSEEQKKALCLFEAWLLQSDKQLFIIAGQAGTGKTTLARELQNIARVHYSAFTNKATHVLRSKGCHPATTLHSLLKTPAFEPAVGKGFGSPSVAVLKFGDRQPGLNLNGPELDFTDKEHVDLDESTILVIDEASMLGDDMGYAVLELPNRIVLIMDPFQLPPIGQSQGFFLNRKPDVFLEEVHRAKNPGVLDIATHIRKHHAYPAYGSYEGGSSIQNFFDLNTETRRGTFDRLIAQADQVICGWNASRVALNRRARLINGLADQDPEGMPVPGDKIVIYRNGTAPRADDPDFSPITIINGSLWSVVESEKRKTLDSEPRHFMTLILKSLDNPNTPNIITKTPDSYFWNPYPDDAARQDGGWHILTFGYAISCHKAQGSEWNSVLVVDQSWGDTFRPYRWNWLYTAATRAAFQANIIRGPWL